MLHLILKANLVMKKGMEAVQGKYPYQMQLYTFDTAVIRNSIFCATPPISLVIKNKKQEEFN